MPIGIYTYPPDEIPGIDAIQVPHNFVTDTARKGWEFANWLDSLRPNWGDAWRWGADHLNPF